jgi:hypothetical protein
MNTVEEIKKISLINIQGDVEFASIDGTRCTTENDFQELLSSRITDLIAQVKRDERERLSKEIADEVERIEQGSDDTERNHKCIDDVIVEKLGGRLEEIYNDNYGWGWYC